MSKNPQQGETASAQGSGEPKPDVKDAEVKEEPKKDEEKK